MKVGLRKPNVKTRVRARTTGRAKRALKKSINPLYGKKGMGMINNPKKAMYNKIYNKTTVSVDDLIKSSSGSHDSDPVSSSIIRKKYSRKQLLIYSILFAITGVFCILVGIAAFPVGIIILVLGILMICCSVTYAKERNRNK